MKWLLWVSCISAAALFLAGNAMADSWAPPKETSVYSQDSTILARMIPGNGETRLCSLYVYRRGHHGETRLLRGVNLRNPIAPYTLLLSNDGSRIVGIDQWYALGFGPDVVCIYDSAGRVVRSYSLEELIPEDSLRGPGSVGVSRDWGWGHYLDEGQSQLILRRRIFGSSLQSSQDWRDPELHDEIRLDLQSGSVIWPEWAVEHSRRAAAETKADP